jgi:acetyl-CoA synthetase
MGQIAVRRPDPVMFSGYWNNPDASEHKFNGDWLLTGDLGIRDADGYFWFQGRADDVINSAGYRIGPTEIENCLLRHPSVALAAVIGIPDELRGEVIKAYIVPRAGALPGPELAGEIRKHVRSRLAEYLYPREIEFMENLPLTTTGKVRRNDLREQHERTRTHRKD